MDHPLRLHLAAPERWSSTAVRHRKRPRSAKLESSQLPAGILDARHGESLSAVHHGEFRGNVFRTGGCPVSGKVVRVCGESCEYLYTVPMEKGGGWVTMVRWVSGPHWSVWLLAQATPPFPMPLAGASRTIYTIVLCIQWLFPHNARPCPRWLILPAIEPKGRVI